MGQYEVGEVGRGQVLPGCEALVRNLYSILHVMRSRDSMLPWNVVEVTQVREDRCWDQSRSCGMVRSSQVLAGLLTDRIWGVSNGKNNRNIPNYMGGNKFYASHIYPQGSRLSQCFITLNWLTYEVLVNLLHH